MQAFDMLRGLIIRIFPCHCRHKSDTRRGVGANPTNQKVAKSAVLVPYSTILIEKEALVTASRWSHLCFPS